MYQKVIFVSIMISSYIENVNSKRKIRVFPADFEFGASSAAYQVEGGWYVDGKGLSIWDLASHKEPSPIADKSTGDVSADAYHHSEEDVKLMADLGLNFYKFSISWTRILPSGFPNKINVAGIDYYDKLIDGLLKANITPFVTLYHYDLPHDLQRLGGWVNPNVIEWFTFYAKTVFDKFAYKVKHWITINNPDEICHDGYGSDRNAPMLNLSGIAEYLCTKNILLAHAHVYHLYDTSYKKLHSGKVGIALNFDWYEPASELQDDMQASIDTRQFNWGLYANPIFSKFGDYPIEVKQNVDLKSAEQGYTKSRLPELTADEVTILKNSADFLGVNSFRTSLIYRDASLEGLYHSPSLMDDMNSILEKDATWPQSPDNWLQEVPWGLFKVLMEIKKSYDNPTVYITANGWPTKGGLLDDDRIKYLRRYMAAMLDAIAEGCKVKGYAVWALMDGFEWKSGYTKKYGLYEVDFANPDRKRIPRKSSFVYKEIIKTHNLDPNFEPQTYIMEVVEPAPTDN